MRRASKASGPSSFASRQPAWPRAAAELALVVTLGGCNSAASVEQEVVRPVKAAVVGIAGVGRKLTYSGVVRPRIESALGFRVSGKIVERSVNVGDRVEVD
jgi:membrane fusion protein, multidrug efflux system